VPDLSPEVKSVMERVRKESPGLRAAFASFAEARAMRKRETPGWVRLPMADMAKVEDRTIEGKGGPLKIRICTPKTGTAPRPVALFFHTGGFVFGDLDTDDPQCRYLADKSGCIMVSVEYRLAPESKFPGAYEDAITAWEWMVKHAKELGGDGVRFGVSGGSAGGNLTANVCRYARDSGGPRPSFQCVFVAAFNVHPPLPSHALQLGASSPEYQKQLRDAYRSSEDNANDVRYAPLIGKDFSGHPPAFICVAECDTFYDEGKLYAEKLRAAGVPVELHDAKGQIHQVFSWAGGFSEGPKVLDRAAAHIRKHTEAVYHK
jgi:acetyl esterase